MSFAPLFIAVAMWQGAIVAPEPPAKNWASIGFTNTNGRTGPGADYPIKWVYNPRGLPVIVLHKASEWSKIEDMDGEVLWMHNSVLRTRLTALVIAEQPVPLLADTKKRKKVLARLAKHVVVRIESCAQQQCLVRVDNKKGWLPKTALWGPVQVSNTLTD
ncbi:MAG: hypothetical protein JKX99_11055 [Robiginitomaculum sp.]|nr:hypothetical protein [Robiginitomaculum sp.]